MAIYTIKTLNRNDIPNPLVDKDVYTTIIPSNNIYENGQNLIDAYNRNLNKLNYTIFLMPGTYDLSGRNLNLSGYSKIIGLSENSSSVAIQSAFSGKGSGVLHETNGSAYLSNLTVTNIFTGIENYMLQPNATLENPIINNIQRNNPFVRSAFSSNTQVSFSSGFQKGILFNQIYIYDNELEKHKIIFKEFSTENRCRYIVQELPNEIDQQVLSLNDYETNTFLESNKKIFSIGIWKLVSGFLSGNSLTIDSVLAIENPKLNNNYNPLSNRSLKYIPQGWPWLVENWVWANISPIQSYPSGCKLVNKKTYINNVVFPRGNQSLGMNAPSYYGGNYINCESAECSFGGNGGFLNGNFVNCKSLSYSFAPQYYRSGAVAMQDFNIENCSTEAYGLGHFGTIKNGIIKNCKAGKREYPIDNAYPGEIKENSAIINLIQLGGTGFNH